MHIRRFTISILLLALIAAACSTSDSEDPAAVLEDYVAAYNAGDIDLVMTFFSEDSVVTGHPRATESSGLTAIRQIHGEVGSGDSYTITITDVDGDTVTWDHVWHNDEADNCVNGHTAVIKDNRILSWAWPRTDFQCR
jgi:hypothetical protein